MALITSVVALGVMAVATVYSAQQTSKASKEQRKAIQKQQRQADIANARERRAAIRNARVMRASIESQAATTGLTGSSAAAGAASNVQSRLGENLSFLDQNQMLSAQASYHNEMAAKYANRANKGMAVASIAGNVMGAAGSYGGARPAGAG